VAEMEKDVQAFLLVFGHYLWRLYCGNIHLCRPGVSAFIYIINQKICYVRATKCPASSNRAGMMCSVPNLPTTVAYILVISSLTPTKIQSTSSVSCNICTTSDPTPGVQHQQILQQSAPQPIFGFVLVFAGVPWLCSRLCLAHISD
jgi:hypothetical protein